MGSPVAAPGGRGPPGGRGAAQPHLQFQDFVASCKAPAVHQQVALRKILGLHRNVDIIQRNGVQVPADWAPAADGGSSASTASGVSPVDLLRKLPLTTFSDYQMLIEKAIDAGRAYDEAQSASVERWEAAVARLSGLPLTAFWCSSGTTGSLKCMPASILASESNFKAFGVFSQCLNTAFPNAGAGKELRFPFVKSVEVLPNGVQIGGSSSITYYQIVSDDKLDPNFQRLVDSWMSPKQVIMAGSMQTSCYLHWLCALCQRGKVTALTDIFASGLVLAVNLLADHWPQLMADLRTGRCFSWLADDNHDSSDGVGSWPGGLSPPPEDVAAAVNDVLEPMPESLAEELQQVFEGGRQGLLERLFPQLLYVACILTGSMSKYVPHLRELLPVVPFLSAGYGATEGHFGISSDLVEFTAAALGDGGGITGAISYAAFPREPDGNTSYILMPANDCYMEFIPLEHTDEQQPPAVSMEELEVGRRYEMVATGMLGLFWARIGDILRCVGHFHEAPKVVVEGRLGQALYLVGEKMPEAALLSVVAAAAEKMLTNGARGLTDWAAREVVHATGGAGKSTAGHYLLYMELAAAPSAASHAASGDSSGGGMPNAAELEEWAAQLEAALQEAAPPYRSFRAVGRIAGLQLKLVAPGAFAEIRQLGFDSGVTAAQYKPPVVVNKAAQIEVLERHVVAAATFTGL